jgi:uncharacterized protein involved in exopolysaccharide biosynthesis
VSGRAADITLLAFSRAVRREWKLAMAITLGAAVLAAIIALVLPEKFEGSVVVVDANRARSGGMPTALLGQLGGLAGLAGIDISQLSQGSGSARAILNSRVLVAEFIERNDLLPILFRDDWDAGAKRWTTDADDTPTSWLGARMFIDDVLRIEEDTVSGTIRVTVEWDDPELAADWANGLVALANQIVRNRDLADAEKSVAYLKGEIEKTNIVGLQQVLYSLVESEMQTIMLAKIKEEYAFSVVDPAVVPELRSSPIRSLIVVVGAALGGFLALMIILVRLVIRMEAQEQQSGG